MRVLFEHLGKKLTIDDTPAYLKRADRPAAEERLLLLGAAAIGSAAGSTILKGWEQVPCKIEVDDGGKSILKVDYLHVYDGKRRILGSEIRDINAPDKRLRNTGFEQRILQHLAERGPIKAYKDNLRDDQQEYLKKLGFKQHPWKTNLII
jgi:hypothetical protein